MTPSQRFNKEIYPLRPLLHQYAGKLTNDKDDAKDLLSETFLLAFRFIESFDGKNAKAWSMRIMRNAFVNQYRRNKSRPDVYSYTQAIEESIGDNVVDHGYSDRYAAALRSLKADHRNVFYLTCIEDYSYEETSSILDINIGTIRSRIHASRKKLKEKLAEK